MANHIATITKIAKDRTIDYATLTELLHERNEGLDSFISVKARKASADSFSGKVTFKGAVSISNVCKSDCFFCGIRKGNLSCKRFTLAKDEILDRVKLGYDNGIRNFELRGGESEELSDNDIVDIVTLVKEKYPDAVIELALGEKRYSSYLSFFRAGVKGYTLRFEAADAEVYSRLCPTSSIDNRQISIAYLKQVGFDAGSGFLVGAPFKKSDKLSTDILYIQELSPNTIDIAPFIPHKDTPLAKFKAGSAEKTLFTISVLRLLCPQANIVASELLDLLDEKGREKAVAAGANVVTVSLDSEETDSLYNICDKEIGYADPVKTIQSLKTKLSKLGFTAV